MAITVNIGPCPPRLVKETWGMLGTFPRALSCRIVEGDLTYLKDGEYDDEAAWRDMQVKAMAALLSDAAMAVALVHGGQNIDDLVKIRGRPFPQRSTIVWGWGVFFPLIASPFMRRNYFPLQGDDDVTDLVMSSAWTEAQGTFALFSYIDDPEMISRFIAGKWTAADLFTAVTPYGEWANWVVVSNRCSENELQELLERSFA